MGFIQCGRKIKVFPLIKLFEFLYAIQSRYDIEQKILCSPEQ